MKADSDTIASAISRDRLRRTRMTTRRSGGREAISHYRVLERFESEYGKFSLLEVKIDTGRTHQIRVHLASVGHPVAGDTLYGAPREIKRSKEPRLGANKDARLSRATRPPAGGANRRAQVLRGQQKAAQDDSAILPDGAPESAALPRNF